MLELIQDNCLRAIHRLGQYKCIFADPPDNIGLNYGAYNDSRLELEYLDFLERCLEAFSQHSGLIWISFNACWTFGMGEIFQKFLRQNKSWLAKPCVQTFTFGQYNSRDFANNHRPLWRLMHKTATTHPQHILEESWRLRHGDKRAKPGGRVPGDVFDFPRVTGNSQQRRNWHPTQLNEGLVERCILASTLPGEWVLDPFAGTGTTLRVCKKLERGCTTIEIDADYCRRIAAEHGLPIKVTP